VRLSLERRPVDVGGDWPRALRLGPPRDHTLCAMPSDPHVHERHASRINHRTVNELGKRCTATFWGSSGRRFKSCQPDVEKQALTCSNDPKVPLYRFRFEPVGTTDLRLRACRSARVRSSTAAVCCIQFCRLILRGSGKPIFR